MLIKILLKFLQPKKIFKFMLRKEIWNPKVHSDFIEEYQKFVLFLIWVNKKEDSCFSKISFDVLVYKIIPFITERDVVLTKYEKVVNYYLLLKGFDFSEEKYNRDINLSMKYEEFKENIKRILSKSFDGFVSSGDPFLFMIGLKILNKISCVKNEEKTPLKSYNKICENIKIEEKTLLFFLKYFNLFFNKFIENEKIMYRVDERIIKNSIIIFTKFTNRFSLNKIIELVPKLCSLLVRQKELKRFEMLVMGFFVEIVLHSLMEAELCNELIKNFTLVIKEKTNVSSNSNYFICFVRRIIESKLDVNEKKLLEFIREIGKLNFCKEISDGKLFLIGFIASCLKIIEVEQIFNKNEFYNGLVKIIKVINEKIGSVFYLKGVSSVDCVEIVNSDFDYSNPNFYINLMLNSGLVERDILESVVFFINQRKLKNLEMNCDINNKNQIIEMNSNFLFEELDKLDKLGGFIFSDETYQSFFNHCVFLIKEVYFIEEFKKFLEAKSISEDRERIICSERDYRKPFKLDLPFFETKLDGKKICDKNNSEKLTDFSKPFDMISIMSDQKKESKKESEKVKLTKKQKERREK